MPVEIKMRGSNPIDISVNGNLVVSQTTDDENIQIIDRYGNKIPFANNNGVLQNASYPCEYDPDNYIMLVDADITGTGTTTGSGQFRYYSFGSYNVIAVNEDGVTVDNFAISGTGVKTLTFSKGGKWMLEFSNGIKSIMFNYTYDRSKVLEIRQWGTAQWTSFTTAFYGCSNMNVTATDVPNLSSVSNMSYMFYNCTSLTTLDVSSWDVSSATNMAGMFRDCTSLTTLDVSSWDVSSLTIAYAMLQGCGNFTSDIDFSDPIKGSINLREIHGMMAGTRPERLLLQAGNLLSPVDVPGNPSNWIASPNMKEVKLIGMKNDVNTTVGYGSAGAMTGEAWADLLESFDISQSKNYKLSPTAYSAMETYVQGLGYADISDYLLQTNNNWTVIS